MANKPKKPRGKAEPAETPPLREKQLSGPSVAQCTRFMQRRVAAHLPGILEDLLEKSKGDASTLKALWQMSKLDGQEAATRKRKGSLAREILQGSSSVG